MNPLSLNRRHTSMDIAWILVYTWYSTSKEEIRKVHPFPQAPPVDNVFNIHLTKNIIEHKE